MTEHAVRGRRPLTLSVFLRCAAVVAVVTAIVAIAVSVQTSMTARSIAVDGVRELAAEVTPFAASQIGGALRFSKPEDATAVLARLLEDGAGTANSAVVLRGDGTVFATAGPVAGESDPLVALGRQALAEGRIWASDGTITLAEPVSHGAEGATMGVLVTGWSAKTTLDRIAKANRRGAVFAGAVFLALLAGAGVLLRSGVSAPLRRVGAAMANVAQGDYDSPIPGRGRRDEIGEIARELDQLREQLAAARGATEDAMFKGAGFRGSSAALLLADAAGTVRFANPAFCRMTSAILTPGRPEAGDADDLTGRPLASVAAEFSDLAACLASGTGFPWEGALQRGDIRVALRANDIRDADGGLVGAVLEWTDVTETGLHRAAIEALETSQAVAEISTDGRIARANRNFADMLGRDAAGLTGTALAEIAATGGDGADLTAAIAAGEARFARFPLRRADGGSAMLDGGCLPVRDAAGQIFRLLLIGADVTASDAAIKAAEADRKRFEDAQKQVVDALRDGLSRLSEGDLGVTIDTVFTPDYDQLRIDFNEAAGRLDTAMQAVLETAQSILGEAGEITSAADDLSRRTEHQAATLEQTAAALAQITASVGSAANGARQADEVVTDARRRAEASGSVVEEAVTAMGEIEASSDRISKIIGVIDDIAFQTNLLALNAGVEAARAGDAGRGFAVVASEVRALAQRSSEAAREINELISVSGQHVARGVALVDDAGAALKRIVESVGDISSHVTTIAASAQEQSTALEEINTAMSQLDQVTQQNAAMFEETTAASHSLAREAQTLTETTAHFRTSAASPAALQGSPKASRGPAPAATPAGGFQTRRAPSGPAPLASTSGRRGRAAALAETVDAAEADDSWEEF